MAVSPARRLPTVDISRGWLMALIIATHVFSNVDPHVGTRVMAAVRIALSGTVGFVTVSGILVGYFLVAKAGDLPRVFQRYTSRAVLLVLLAHPLIAVAVHGPSGVEDSLLDFVARSVFVTDVLAFLFLVAVPRLPRLVPPARLALGLILLVAARLILIVPAQNYLWVVTREVLAGVDPRGLTTLHSTYPLLSLAGMFLVGSWIGHRYALARDADRLPQLARRFCASAAALLIASVVLEGAWTAVRRHLGGVQAPLVEQFLGGDYTFALYPAYLGAVLVPFAVLMVRKVVGPLERFLLVFGRSSLFTYVAQYYVVQTLPWALRWRHRMTPLQAAMYLLVALPAINVAVVAFERLKAASLRRGYAGASPG